MPEIHELKPMDLWEAWQNEARDFTPWLAEHLERLGTELNLDLQLEGQEVTLPRGDADRGMYHFRVSEEE